MTVATRHATGTKPHDPALPLRLGSRGSPLALIQTRLFLHLLTTFCPVLRGMSVFEEHAIRTTGDRVQDRRLAEIGGKGERGHPHIGKGDRPRQRLNAGIIDIGRQRACRLGVGHNQLRSNGLRRIGRGSPVIALAAIRPDTTAPSKQPRLSP